MVNQKASRDLLLTFWLTILFDDYRALIIVSVAIFRGHI